MNDLRDGALALDAPCEGWLALPAPHTVMPNSFVSGDPQGTRLRVAYFVRERDQALVGRVWFGPQAQGPPLHSHGGAMAAVLDEVMGVAAWLRGHRAVAARLDVEFKKPLRLDTTITFEARVTSVERRVVNAQAELVLPHGTVCARATGVFVVTDVDKLS